MTTAVKTREDATRRYEKAQRRCDELMREAAESRSSGATMLPPDLAAKARAAEVELQAATLDAGAARRDAAGQAQTELVTDPAYRRLIADTLDGIVEANKAAIGYEVFRLAAGRNGACALALPDFAASEILGIKLWTRELLRRRLLTPDQIPALLAAIMPGVQA